MTISVTDTATGQELSVREFSAALAMPVRVLDGHTAVSAPYSRAEGILDKQGADARRDADEYAAWLQGQAAQTAAEIRHAADEELAQHRAVRVDIAERNRREGTFNLPPGFEDLPITWAVVQPASVAQAESRSVTTLFDKDNPHDRIGLGVGPALRARYGTVSGQSPYAGRDATLDAMVRHNRPVRGGWTPPPRPVEDFAPAADENMPGRDGTWVALDPTPDSGYVRTGAGVNWRAEWAQLADDLRRPLRALRAWWRAKQAQRDQRMGV